MTEDKFEEFFQTTENNFSNAVASTKVENQGISILQIAQAFSNGEFSQVYEHFADHIVWNVVEENEFIGKNAVIQNCEQVRKYFDSVTTDFKTILVMGDHNKVVVNGTGEFIRDGKTLLFVSACDIYEFNDLKRIERITSYCIQRNR